MRCLYAQNSGDRRGLHGMSFYFGAGVLPDDLGDHAPAALAVPPALRPQGQTGSEEAQEGKKVVRVEDDEDEEEDA